MEQDLERVADFLFEIGMLKATPRTGYRFLGSGGESVAEHSFRTAVIGHTLARLHREEVDAGRVVLLCLFHDAPEARTGDMNYVYKKYNQTDEARAARDLVAGLPFGGEIAAALEEFNARESVEARLARDADQLDLLCNLIQERDRGNRQASDWIPFLLERLTTDAGRQLAAAIDAATSERWWFADKGRYWVNAKGEGGP